MFGPLAKRNMIHDCYLTKAVFEAAIILDRNAQTILNNIEKGLYISPFVERAKIINKIKELIPF